MKILWIRLYLILIVSLVSVSQLAFACTDVRTTAKDGSIIIGRTMEFALDLKSNLRTSTRGRAFTTIAADGTSGLDWKAKYGYVFLDGLNVDATIDGMNEKGLSFEALFLPGKTQYQAVPTGQSKKALPYIYIGDWVLGNFDSVDQVREALGNVFVFEQKIPSLGDFIFPLHFSIYDSTGKGIVVEYVNGKLNIYDNTIGILTNTPTYDWQLTNLDNFVNLAPQNPNPVIQDGVTFARD